MTIPDTTVTVISQNVIQVATVGIQGPAGPPGPAAPVLMGNVNIVSTNAITVILIASARYGFTIMGVYGIAVDTGSTTITISINGTPVTGLNAAAVTTTPQNILATGNNVVNVGDEVTYTLPGSPTGTNFRFTMGGSMS